MFFGGNRSAVKAGEVSIDAVFGSMCVFLCIISPIAQITKYSIFYICGFFTVFFAILSIIYKGHIRISGLRSLAPILLLFLMMFVSSLWAPFPKESLWRASIHLIFLWMVLIAFKAASNGKLTWFYYTAILVPYLILIMSLLIYFRYGTIRPDSKEMWESIGSFANIAPAIVTPLISFHMYLHLMRWNKWLNLGGLYSAVIVVLISQSRGGYLMLAIILLCSPILFSTNYAKKAVFLIKVLIICGIMVASITGLFGYESTIGRVVDRFSSSQLLNFLSAESPVRGESDYRRFIQYATGISIIGSHPIMGVGFYGFSTYMGERLVDIEGNVAHNIFFNVWGEMGIVGLLAFIWLSYRSLAGTLRGRLECKRLCSRSGFLFYSALNMAILVSLLHAQFRPQLTNPIFYVVFALSLACHPRISVPGKRH